VTASAPTTAAGVSTVIGATMRIKGSLQSPENVNLNGEFEGQMEVQGRLVVGPEGKAVANLKVGELLVGGLVKGNVDAGHRVSLKQGANLVGDVKTPGIVIEDGAFFKGGIDIKRAGSENQA
jgi:cytoskeletal protein CcmA (bactofilin family)